MKNKLYVFWGLIIIMVFLWSCSPDESQKTLLESNLDISKNKAKIEESQNDDEDDEVAIDDGVIAEIKQKRPTSTRYMVRLPEVLFSGSLQNKMEINKIDNEIKQVKEIFDEFHPFYHLIAESIIVLPGALLQHPAMLYSQFRKEHPEGSEGEARKLFKKTTWSIKLSPRVFKLIRLMMPVLINKVFFATHGRELAGSQKVVEWQFSPNRQIYERVLFEFLPGEEKERGIRVQTAWNADDRYELYWTYSQPGKVKDKIRWQQTDSERTKVVFWHLPREYESYFLKQTQDGHRVGIRVKAYDKKTQGVRFYVQRGNASYNGYADTNGIYIDSDKRQLFALDENGAIISQDSDTYQQMKSVYQQKLTESSAPRDVNLAIPSDEAEEEK